MMRHALLAAIGSLLVAGPAAAQAIDPDVRCMLVSNFFSQAEKDPGRKQLSAVAGVFYFGRVDARLSLPQVKSQMIALNKVMKPADLPAIMTNCARQMGAKQQAFATMGKTLAPAAGKPAAPPAPRK